MYLPAEEGRADRFKIAADILHSVISENYIGIKEHQYFGIEQII